MMTRLPHISICIATYKRVLLLEKLIRSLLFQKTGQMFSYSLVIVDNDKAMSAKEMVIQMKEKTTISIDYFLQPIKNISLTRNMAVKHSKGEYLAFIDDDEYAEEDWLINLYITLSSYKADIVFGPVISYFDKNTCELITRFFQKKRYVTGPITEISGTYNCLIKSTVIAPFTGPFNPQYGLTGGEDTELFNNVRAKGNIICWADEAIVYEYIPEVRANISWIINRTFKDGSVFVDIFYKNTGFRLLSLKSAWSVFKFFCAGSLLFLSLILYPFLYASSKLQSRKNLAVPEFLYSVLITISQKTISSCGELHGFYMLAMGRLSNSLNIQA